MLGRLVEVRGELGSGADQVRDESRFADFLDGGARRDRCNGGPGLDRYIHCEFVEGHPFP